MSPAFASAVISETLEGSTLYTEGMRLLGVSRMSEFDRLAKKRGIAR